MGVAGAEVKQPVAMRLPRYEVDIVNAFAESHGVSKTDAFLHFLRRGIEAERNGGLDASRIASSLDEILQLLKGTASLDVEAISTIVRDEAPKFPAIRRAILFGSFAREEATEQSDVDIRLELDDRGKFSLYDLARFQKAIEQRTSRDVDVVTAREIANENLAQAIEREGVVVYERKA
ncbi:MAG: nucleotidyltransferase domain-containing protein [Eggerthellaceae bacterium]|nr:nucleotidyltransferase domain-containing protein [Eggerthellaceae bacterium]